MFLYRQNSLLKSKIWKTDFSLWIYIICYRPKTEFDLDTKDSI